MTLIDRHLVVLRVALFQFITQFRDRAACGADLSQHPERDHAIGLNQEFTIERRINHRLDTNAITDVEFVRFVTLHFRQSVDELQFIADSQAILGHVHYAAGSHILALSEHFPRNGATGVPQFLTTAVAALAIHAHHAAGLAWLHPTDMTLSVDDFRPCHIVG